MAGGGRLIAARCVLAAFALATSCGPAGAAPEIGGCPMFPAGNVWNVRVDGLTFGVQPAGDRAGTRRSPVCRYYGRPEAGIDSHFHSASPAECAAVGVLCGNEWTLESSEVFVVALPDPSSGACPPGSVPVYRVFNGRHDANHRYVTSPALRDAMVAAGWIAEGYGAGAVAMGSMPTP